METAKLGFQFSQEEDPRTFKEPVVARWRGSEEAEGTEVEEKDAEKG